MTRFYGSPEELLAERGPGRRPGAAKKERLRERTAAEKREAIQKRIRREMDAFDFTRRCLELRRLAKTYPEIAATLSTELGEPITAERVRRNVLNHYGRTEAGDVARQAEIDKVESMAAKIREQIDAMEQATEVAFDLEVYSKLADTYLKYRDRIARLMGLDKGGNQGGLDAKGFIKEAGPAPGQATELHLHLPGSVTAYAEWARLQAEGSTGVVEQVIELEAAADDEIVVDPDRVDGVNLREVADVSEPDYSEPNNSLDALAMLVGDVDDR